MLRFKNHILRFFRTWSLRKDKKKNKMMTSGLNNDLTSISNKSKITGSVSLSNILHVPSVENIEPDRESDHFDNVQNDSILICLVGSLLIDRKIAIFLMKLIVIPLLHPIPLLYPLVLTRNIVMPERTSLTDHSKDQD